MDSSSSSSDGGEEHFNVIVLGNSAVGKTSLIQQYCSDHFIPSYKQTIGLNFYSKKVEIPQSAKTVTLQMWDIGGQQMGGKMLSNYIQSAHAVCYVYDMTNPSSLEGVGEWHEAVLAAFQNGAAPYMVLAGNKADLPNIQVPDALHKKAAAMHGMDACHVSARSGEGVHTLFTMIAAKLSGLTVPTVKLGDEDHFVANIESRPQERVSVLRSAQQNKVGRSGKGSDNDCVLM